MVREHSVRITRTITSFTAWGYSNPDRRRSLALQRMNRDDWMLSGDTHANPHYFHSTLTPTDRSLHDIHETS